MNNYDKAIKYYQDRINYELDREVKAGKYTVKFAECAIENAISSYYLTIRVLVLGEQLGYGNDGYSHLDEKYIIILYPYANETYNVSQEYLDVYKSGAVERVITYSSRFLSRLQWMEVYLVDKFFVPSEYPDFNMRKHLSVLHNIHIYFREAVQLKHWTPFSVARFRDQIDKMAAIAIIKNFHNQAHNDPLSYENYGIHIADKEFNSNKYFIDLQELWSIK